MLLASAKSGHQGCYLSIHVSKHDDIYRAEISNFNSSYREQEKGVIARDKDWKTALDTAYSNALNTDKFTTVFLCDAYTNIYDRLENPEKE